MQMRFINSLLSNEDLLKSDCSVAGFSLHFRMNVGTLILVKGFHEI